MWQVIVEFPNGVKHRATDEIGFKARKRARSVAHSVRDALRRHASDAKRVLVFGIDENAPSVFSEDPWAEMKPDTILVV